MFTKNAKQALRNEVNIHVIVWGYTIHTHHCHHVLVMDNMNRRDLNGQNSVVCEHVIITAWVIAIINTNLSNSLSFFIHLLLVVLIFCKCPSALCIYVWIMLCNSDTTWQLTLMNLMSESRCFVSKRSELMHRQFWTQRLHSFQETQCTETIFWIPTSTMTCPWNNILQIMSPCTQDF